MGAQRQGNWDKIHSWNMAFVSYWSGRACCDAHPLSCKLVARLENIGRNIPVV